MHFCTRALGQCLRVRRTNCLLRTRAQEDFVLTRSLNSDSYSKKTGYHDGEKYGISEFSGAESAKQVKPFSDIPGPRSWPLLGSWPTYISPSFKPSYYHVHLKEMHRIYGPIYKEGIGEETTVHISDPRFAQEVYRTEGAWPRVPPLLTTVKAYREYRNLSVGIGNMNDEEWSNARSAAQVIMMRPGACHSFLPKVDQVARDFMTFLEEELDPQTGLVKDVYDKFKRWNFESTCLVTFEKRMDAFRAPADDPSQEMIKTNEQLMKSSLLMKFAFQWFKMIPSKHWRDIVNAEDCFYGHGLKIFEDAIQRYRAEPVENLENGRFAMLSHFLSQDKWSLADITATALTVVADSQLATVPTLGFFLYCLADNPSKQEALFQEISSLKTGLNEPLVHTTLKKMKYFNACLKETLRLYPNTIDIGRYTGKDLILGGYDIPAGSKCCITTGLMQRSPEYFDFPEDFRPERWLRGHAQEENVHPFLNVPFSFGPRMCIGKRIAEQDIAVLTFRLLQRYKIEWAAERELGQHYNMLMHPDMNPVFRFIPRNQQTKQIN